MSEIVVYVARKIRTMEPSLPEATAVAVRDGQIVEVGSLETLKPWLDAHPHRIDRMFEKHVLTPGFIDPHLHPAMAAYLLQCEFITAMEWQLPHKTVSPKGLGYDAITAGRMFSLFIAVNLVFGLGAAWLSQRLMQKKMPSRQARGVLTAVATLIAAACYASMLIPALPPIVRVVILGVGMGLSQAIYYTGPAIIGEITPKPQRASILAIDNSVASIAGIIAPVVTGYLVQSVSGGAGTGYDVGFAVTGGFLAVAGLVGWVLIHPANSAQRVRGATTAYVR